VVFDALSDPDLDPRRPWLMLMDDEQRPMVLRSQRPSALTWSSLWIKRLDATVTFALPASDDGGTDLEWTLSVAEPAPDDALTGHMRKRLNQLVNADLRYTFGQ
jgi:hypothetical protein